MPMTSPRNPPDRSGSAPSERESVPDAAPSPDAPAIPSFESLRSPRRRTAVDVLVPQAPAERPAPGRAGSPRPAEYADLWRLGLRTAQVLAGVPWRLASWSVRTPVACVGRLLGR